MSLEQVAKKMSYITCQLPRFHGMHGLLINPRVFVMALHITDVLLFVLVLLI